MSDSSHASLTRAVELRAAPSIIDMNPIASLGPQVSITVSPISISITPDCTMYMQEPGSFLLNTMLPVATPKNCSAGPAFTPPAARLSLGSLRHRNQRAQTRGRPRAGGHRMARMGSLAMALAAALWLWPAMDADADE